MKSHTREHQAAFLVSSYSCPAGVGPDHPEQDPVSCRSLPQQDRETQPRPSSSGYSGGRAVLGCDFFPSHTRVAVANS